MSIAITAKEMDAYEVLYQWKERVDGPFRQSNVEAKGSSTMITFGNVQVEIDPKDPDKAIAKGDFLVPRTAKLMRRTTSSLDTSKTDGNN